LTAEAYCCDKRRGPVRLFVKLATIAPNWMSASKYGDSGGFLSNNLTDRNAAESQLLLQQERKSRHLDPMEITQLLIVELEATAKAR
jgi:hypothetical protein